MFNSALFEALHNNEIFSCAQKRFIEIIGEYVDWLDDAQNDDEVNNAIDGIFPQYFIARDCHKAKTIIYDLFEIAQSNVIRENLSPIYIYAMGAMLYLYRDWIFDCCNELGLDRLKLIPDSLIEILKIEVCTVEDEEDEDLNKDLDDDSLRNWYIKQWFTDPNTMIMDFEDIYDGDLMSTGMMERIGLWYIASPETCCYQGDEFMKSLICYQMICANSVY